VDESRLSQTGDVKKSRQAGPLHATVSKCAEELPEFFV
jgi:hypothetical protein